MGSLEKAELRYEIEKIKKKLDNQDKNMEIVFRHLDELLEKKKNPKPKTKIDYKLPKNNNFLCLILCHLKLHKLAYL